MRTRLAHGSAPIARSEVVVRWLPSDDDVRRLKSAVSLPWFAPLVDLLDNTGLRIGEVVGTTATYKTSKGEPRVTDRRGIIMGEVIDGDHRLWSVRHEVRVVGKGAKARTVPLNEAARTAVATLVGLHDRIHPRALLVSLTRTYVADVFMQASVTAGFSRTFNAHLMRSRFVTRLVKDHRLTEAMMLAGHSSMDTTLGYNRPSSADLRQAVATPPADGQQSMPF